MSRAAGYRTLCAAFGAVEILTGLGLFASFFVYHAPGSNPVFPTGAVGHYFVAFAGCALVAWGGCLLGAARHPLLARSVGTATALALVLCALMRIVAWLVGDYRAWLGEAARGEAAIFLLLALGFVWLRPPPVARGARWLASVGIGLLLLLVAGLR